jgi:hypothetical protein
MVMPMGPGMGPQSPPNVPPMPPPMEQSPQVDMALMRDLYQQISTDDGYGRNFKQPPRPDMSKMYDLGLRKFMDYDLWRRAVRHDLQLLRMDVHGIFPDDKPMLDAGILDDYESTGLVDEYNLAVSFLSGLNHRFLKHPCGREEYQFETRKVQLAAEHLYQMESRQHADLPEMSTAILEPKILLAYGTIWKCRTLNRNAEEYESPFTVRYIDPAQIVYDRGTNGAIKRLWRIYNATAGELMAAYGDFSSSVTKKLKEKYPDWDEDTELINVCEYWDPWWRFVCASEGLTILPVTEHKYGEVPFTPGFGPLGEPQATRLPEEYGSASVSKEMFREQLPHKSVGFIRYMKRPHLIRDAVMTRYLYGQKLELWPPVVVQENLDAGADPQPDMQPFPNEPNYVSEGRELKPYPFPNRAQDKAALLGNMDQDTAKGKAPLAAFGIMDQSNISGTANKQALSAGRHLWQPWSHTLDDFLGRDLTKAMRIWQRLGNTVIYGQYDRTRTFTVPNTKPRKGETRTFELDPTVIAKVGPHVYVKSDATDFADTVRANTFKILNESGFPKPFLADRLYAIDYGPEMQEESFEEQVLGQMLAHPDFMATFGVPLWVTSELEEHEGDEDYKRLLLAGLQNWIKTVTEPKMMEIELKKQQMQSQLMQMQQPQMLAGGESMNAPTNEQSYSEEQGPGSETGIQGGPRGPVGPRGGQG